MNRIFSIGLGLLLAGSVIATPVDESVDADPDGRVSISNLAGSVEVDGWDENRVQVTGTLAEDVEELIVDRRGNEVMIKVKIPDRQWGRKEVWAKLVVRVPAGNSLDVSTVSADIDVEGVRGEQDLQSVSGDIDTTAYTADIEAVTVSGDVDVKGDGGDGEWELGSVSGDISVEELHGEIEAEVVSGDVSVLSGNFRRVQLNSVNGDIVFRGGLEGDAKMDVETVNGGVDIRFSGDVSARFDVETFNGDIDNCFGPAPERTSRHTPGLELSFTEGAGDARVSIATLNGSLELCRD